MFTMKKVLLKDIAQAAGVSVALVSYVLNGKGKSNRVHQDTQRQVMRIAEKMGYRPNRIARSLRSGKTETIGVVVSDISNPFFAHIARCIEDAAAQLGYTVLFGSSDESADKMNLLISSLWSKGVDGLIVVPCEASTDMLEHWLGAGVPLVLLDRAVKGLNCHTVCLDNRGAGKMATDHLMDSGYKSIAMIAYDADLENMQERLEGYRQAMSAAGLAAETRVVQWGLNPDNELVERDISSLIESGTDAIVFSTNTLALKSLPFLVQKQVNIPHELGVVCFDESEAFSLFSVPLTYLRQPIRDLAHESVKTLLSEIAEKTHPRVHTLGAELVVQASSVKYMQ